MNEDFPQYYRLLIFDLGKIRMCDIKIDGDGIWDTENGNHALLKNIERDEWFWARG